MSREHDIYESLILRLPDGDLTAEETEALRTHLSSCRDCRRLFTVLRDITSVLDEDEDTEPPAALREGVMARVRADRAETEAAAAEPGPEPIRAKSSSAKRTPDKRTADRQTRRRRVVGAVIGAAAACAVIIGGGIFASHTLLGRVDFSSQKQSATLDAGSGFLPAPAPEEAPAAEEDAVLYEAAEAFEAPMEAPAAEAPAAAEITEDAAPMNAAAAEAEASHPLYTWENPASVPDWKEMEFVALLRTDRQENGISEAELTPLAAVEYHGVIYEFLTDSDESVLYWKDAAEGAMLNLSPGTAADLWSIID